MRELIFDTETTGLDAAGGDRLIEIACVELVNRIPTGRDFHRFVSPEGRPVHPDAERIHGISNAFLADKPRFADLVDEFLAFAGDSALVAHNAGFDRGFLNAELARSGRGVLPDDRFVDTLVLARRRHPGAANSLDALCARYGVDLSRRTKHSALIDCQLLAEIYIELTGGRQAALSLHADDRGATAGGDLSSGAADDRRPFARPHPLPPRLTEAERAAHRAFVETLGPDALWRRSGLDDIAL